MKSKKNLVLIGMMASGKSTIGNLISKKLNINFVDIDKIIEKNLNMKIFDIFKKKGEIFLEKKKKKQQLKFLKSYNNVIALGGGAFLNKKIRKEIISNHLSFWLNWDSKTLLNRIKKNKTRPLAANLSNLEINDLILNRSKIYSKANFEINCNKQTKNEIVEKIITNYMKIIKLKVNTKNSKYSIIIGSGIINKLSKILNQNSIKFNKCLLVIDSKIPKSLM